MSHLEEPFLRDEYLEGAEKIQTRYLNEKIKIKAALHEFDEGTASRDYPFYLTFTSASVHDFVREYDIGLNGALSDLSTLKFKVWQKRKNTERYKEIVEYYSTITGLEIVGEDFLKKLKKYSLHNAQPGIHAERVRELRLLRKQLIQTKYDYEYAYYRLGEAIKEFDGEDYRSLFEKGSACKSAATNMRILYFSANDQVSEYEEFLKVNKLDDFK